MTAETTRWRPVWDRRLGLVARAAAAAALVVWTGCSGAPAVRSAAELTNPQLSPAYAQWLAGAPGRMATDEEKHAFLALSNDYAAADFIEAFWSRRDPDPAVPGNPLRDTFERRTQDADRQFTEGGVSGRKTDRGVTYVLYGPPAKTDYEVPRRGGSAIEVWYYPDDAPVGLDGHKPNGVYRFQKVGDVTTFSRQVGPSPRPGLGPHR